MSTDPDILSVTTLKITEKSMTSRQSFLNLALFIFQHFSAITTRYDMTHQSRILNLITLLYLCFDHFRNGFNPFCRNARPAPREGGSEAEPWGGFRLPAGRAG